MLLISFAQRSPANTLANYLNSQDITCRVERYVDQFRVMLENEADLVKAETIAEAFIQNPHHPDFQKSAWQDATPTRLVPPKTASITSLWQYFQGAPYTSLVLLLCLIIHFILHGLGQYQLYDLLKFQPLPQVSVNGEVWRLLTPAFMHSSLLHLVFNLGWWVFLCREIEQKLGIGVAIALLVASGLISNYAQFLVSGPNFLGLSGVVYALLGFCWWLGWLKPGIGISVPRPIVGFMLLWLVIGFSDFLWVDIANTAHLAGLLTGCSMVFTIRKNN